MPKLSGNGRILALGFVLYIVLDFLLTPLGLETRPFSDVTNSGFVGLGLLVVGLVLVIVSLALLFYKPRLVPILAVIGAILYFPALLIDQSGAFSTLQPPAVITATEFAQALVAVIVIAFALRARMEKSASPPGA